MEERTCFNCNQQNLCYKFRAVNDATSVNFNINTDDTPGTRNEIFTAVAKACLCYVPLRGGNPDENSENVFLRRKIGALRVALSDIVRYWNTPQSADLTMAQHADNMAEIAEEALKRIPK